MFFRYFHGCRIPVDLDGLFSGSCFIAGGAPSLMKENLKLLGQPGIVIIAMNNTASKIPTDIWVGLDKPICYSERILKDPKIMKFTTISRRDLMVGKKKILELPNMYFFGMTENFNVHNLLEEQRDFWWIKNVFPVVLQLAYRLGFRRVYLIGCEFKISKENQYCYKTNLDEHQINYNQRAYNQMVAYMKLLKPYFESKGFEVISCTPNSLLNEFYPFVSFKDAVKEILEDFPKKYDTNKCLHSSELSNRYKDIEALKNLVRKKNSLQ